MMAALACSGFLMTVTKNGFYGPSFIRPENGNRPSKQKRPPTEAALLLDDAALVAHERIVSVDLAGKSRPAMGEIFQSLGFIFTLR
jgi:hypothetical protein